MSEPALQPPAPVDDEEFVLPAWFLDDDADIPVGFLPAERILVYATGGLAYGGFSGSSWTLPLNVGTWSHTQAGWTVGAGVEAALGSNWSVKFEYLYMDLGNVGGSSAIVVVPGVTSAAYIFNTRFTDSIARVGLNYKFGGPAAVVARY